MITRRIARPLGAFSSNTWICPSCNPRTAAPAALPNRSPLQHHQRRTILSVPPLNHDQRFAREGIPGLMSPGGYALAWTDYQKMLVMKLNELLAGEPFENKSPKDLLLAFARDPMNASLFNHASMAHNNQFFFDGLSISPQSLDKCPAVKEGLEQSFGSIDTLRTTMLDTATSMFGPGFVWLVWVRPPSDGGSGTFAHGGYRVLTTYIAGTPYPEAGYRQQGVDMATNDAASFDGYKASQQQPANTVGQFGAMSKAGRESAKYPPGGTQVTPVLCVNTWEHVYIYDYGLGGKRRYLSDWWDTIDWHRVEQLVPQASRAPLKFESMA